MAPSSCLGCGEREADPLDIMLYEAGLVTESYFNAPEVSENDLNSR